MGLFDGKKGVILGVANDHSLAWAIAQYLHKEGAELAFNHLPDRGERNRNEMRVRKLAEQLGTTVILPCDVSSDQDIQTFFGHVGEAFGTIDFVVHSIAFASTDDLKGPTLNCSREGFKLAMDISCYSLIAVARAAEPLLNEGGGIVAMSYYGGERVVEGYNMMGVCKAALDMTVRYLALDLGGKNVRVNAISAGPVRTLAASAVGDFREMLSMYQAVSSLSRNITPEEVGKAAAFLLSDLASATTGEILHVDCGYNVMGSPGRAMKAAMQENAR